MKKTEFFCDHCGFGVNERDEYPELKIQLNHITVECDLCSDCFGDLVSQVKEFCGKGNKQ